MLLTITLVIIVIVVITSVASSNKKKQQMEEARQRKLEELAKQKEEQELRIEGYRVALVSKYGDDIGMKLFRDEYFLGMTIEQLIDAKGEPTTIEHEAMKTKEKHTYVYGTKHSGDVFVFENGVLARFKDR